MAIDEVSVGIFHSHQSVTGTTIRRAVTELGHRAVHLPPNDVTIQTRGHTPTLTADVDVVVNWRSLSRSGTSFEVLGLLRTIEEVLPVVNPADSMLLAGHKPAGLMRLLTDPDTSIRVPPFYYAMGYQPLWEEAEWSPDLVQKPPFGGGGADVTSVTHPDDVDLLAGPQTGLLQSYVPTDTPTDSHEDVRAFVVAGNLVTAMKRTAPADDWRTNISQGGTGTAIELPPAAVAAAEDATTTLGLDAAGVDLIQDPHGNWHVLEVNAPAGFKGLHEATGVNVAAYIAATAIRRGGATVSPDRVAAVATDLPLYSDTPDPVTNSFSYADIDHCQIAGERDRHECTPVINREFTGTALDVAVATKIGAGPLTTTVESPLPDDQTRVPKATVGLTIGRRACRLQTAIVDLTDYDASFIVDHKYATIGDKLTTDGEADTDYSPTPAQSE